MTVGPVQAPAAFHESGDPGLPKGGPGLRDRPQVRAAVALPGNRYADPRTC